METYALGVALGALTIALIAMVRTMRLRSPLGPRRHLGIPTTVGDALPSETPPLDDAARTPARLHADNDGDTARRRGAILRLVPSPGRCPRPTATDSWLSVVPGACATAGVMILVTTFAVQNTQPVSVRFLDWHLGLPLAAAILASGIATGLVVAVLALMDRRSLLGRIHRLEHRLRETGEPGRRSNRSARWRRPAGGGVRHGHL